MLPITTFNRLRILPFIIGGSLGLFLQPAPAAAKLVIEFDYTYDSHNFFDANSTEGQQRRARLEQAAALLPLAHSPTLSMAAITPGGGNTCTPGGGNTWSAKILHPGGGAPVTLTDQTLAKDTFVIYVGGRTVGDSDSSAGVLGWANAPYDVSPSGSASFTEAFDKRGPSVASFTIVSNNPWHIGETTAGLNATNQDFLTTAVHEITHLLGIGESQAWFDLIQSKGEGEDKKDFFHGQAAMAVYGGPVPLDQYASHWAPGTMSTVNGVPQETMMDPSTGRGTRQLPTALDLAALQDIGWEVVPEPSSMLLLVIGMAPFCLRRRK